MSKKNISCAQCRYAKPDKCASRSASERYWTAYECANHASDYWGCLLNVTPQGEKQHKITWRGCPQGEQKA